MQEFVYKEREERRLRDLLISSGFITDEILDEIRKSYNKNSYHNFVHALQVAKTVLDLSPDDFTVSEIYTLFYAALFHDAGHIGQAQLLDEYNSLSIGLNLLDDLSEKFDLRLVDKTIFRHAIIWTVFKERWKFENRYSKLMADLDIWTIWDGVLTFIYYSLLIGMEFWVPKEQWVKDYWFFKFVTSINKEFFLTEEAKAVLPRAFSSMKDYMLMSEELKLEMYNVLQNEDITFDEFVNKYKNILQLD